jgi:F420-dependent oxidoreductase-like protein
VRAAVHVSNFTLPGGAAAIPGHLRDVARIADEGGVDTLTVMDHYFQMEGPGRAQDPMLEGYTTLGFLAGQTERIQLGLLVTGVTYRHPGLLATIVTTLDVLSGGRAMLGIGAAWYEREHHGLGVPFPPTGERFDRLGEALEIIRQMWSDDDGPYVGTHYRLAETICEPRPLQQPRPPVMVGGDGERRTLRLVAEHADACNVYARDVATVAHKIDVLHRHCADVGRDPAEVAITVISGDDPFDEGFLATMQSYAGLGVEQVWLGPGPEVGDPAGWTERLVTEVVPRLAQV